MPLFNPSCCANPSIMDMSQKMYANAEGRLFMWDIQGFDTPVHLTNRVCNNCSTHWYGRDGEVQQYSKVETQK
jgi:hypothetical protein